MTMLGWLFQSECNAMGHIKNLLRHFDKYRRRHTKIMDGWLLRWLSHFSKIESQPLEEGQVKQILLMRTNKRIGNMLFLIPFLRMLKKRYPHAEIDLLVHAAWQNPLFAGLGIRQIYHTNLTGKGRLPRAIRVIRDLRRQHYDLLLMPYSSSTDTLLAAFIHGRNKKARHFGKRHLIFKHSMTVAKRQCHAAFAALPLIDAKPDTHCHQLQLSPAEIAAGRQQAKLLRGDFTGPVVAYFRGARGNKALDDKDWQRLLERTEKHGQIKWIELTCADISAPLHPHSQTFSSPDLRQLAATLAALDGFISADTGPLHLADAAGARCYGLFNHTDPIIFGCIGEHSLNIELKDGINLAASEIGSDIFNKTILTAEKANITTLEIKKVNIPIMPAPNVHTA